ncbi:Tigger transposable element-derived protein 6 [Acropora cervicornis]|uniref:Tigger transposable element-derived protein 6 n=1 Tax=Acropora cervicornis TaxID=6130 RepID=A0AAD9PW15_ACRCE|nr:Tigger transposable element-derived protein 6 [Acropora cervicornis]
MRQSDHPDLIKLSRSGFEQFVPVTFHLAVHCCKRNHATSQNSWDMKTLKPKARNGFLNRFKEREGITGQSVCGEEKSVDQDIVHAWCERLPDICLNYSPRDRYNADETGFFWKATPVQTLG